MAKRACRTRNEEHEGRRCEMENSSSIVNGSREFPGEETALAERIKVLKRRLLMLKRVQQPSTAGDGSRDEGRRRFDSRDRHGNINKDGRAVGCTPRAV
jgi:hypothetical protein